MTGTFMDRRYWLKTITATASTYFFPAKTTIYKSGFLPNKIGSDFVPAMITNEYIISEAMWLRFYDEGLISQKTLLKRINNEQR